MEIIVVSDSHGTYDQLSKVVNNYSNADFYFHCGDSELPKQYLSNFYGVEGNNDLYNEYPEHIIMDLNDCFRALVIHGHRQGVYSGMGNLVALAKKYDCNVVFFGHTHIFRQDYVDGVYIVNPGCLIYNRDFTPGSFARVVIENDKFSVTRLNVNELE